jgi:hypothetical protein
MGDPSGSRPAVIWKISVDGRQAMSLVVKFAIYSTLPSAAPQIILKLSMLPNSHKVT